MQGYEFHKGFVELVKISAADFLEFGLNILKAAPVQHLDLVATKGYWHKLHSFSAFRSVRSLSLDDNDLSDEDVSWIAGSPVLKGLRWLTLINNNISYAGISALAAEYRTTMGGLDYVSFEGNPSNPVENLSADGDLITAEWLPEQGRLLESRFGPIKWLHRDAAKLSQIPPDRFSLAHLDSQPTSRIELQ